MSRDERFVHLVGESLRRRGAVAAGCGRLAAGGGGGWMRLSVDGAHGPPGEVSVSAAAVAPHEAGVMKPTDVPTPWKVPVGVTRSKSK